jgi:hypothetical protein
MVWFSKIKINANFPSNFLMVWKLLPIIAGNSMYPVKHGLKFKEQQRLLICTGGHFTEP